MDKDRQKILYFTVAYLNTVNRPPTTFEAWRFFIDLSGQKMNSSFSEVAAGLKNLCKNNKILEKNGFWVLPSQKNNAGKRVAMQKLSISKIKRAAKWAKWLEMIPYCRGVVFTGALAFLNCRKKSDWDILVITKEGRIWLGRLFVTFFLILLGKKRTDKKNNDRFCLNHFMTKNNLIFPDRNEYSATGLSLMQPILGKEYFDKMQQINFAWYRTYLSNFSRDVVGNDQFSYKNNFLVKVRNFLEFILESSGIGDFLNQKCRYWMIKKIERNPKTYRKNAFIVYNDGELAFWPKPKRIENLKKVQGSF
ncbi:MAG: hypothetical protein R6V40_01745 [Candidatus Moraniibacteriota bacterium]